MLRNQHEALVSENQLLGARLGGLHAVDELHIEIDVLSQSE